MTPFRSKKRDVDQASLDVGTGLQKRHHGLSSSLDDLLDIAKEDDECLGTASENTASESGMSNSSYSISKYICNINQVCRFTVFKKCSCSDSSVHILLHIHIPFGLIKVLVKSAQPQSCIQFVCLAYNY